MSGEIRGRLSGSGVQALRFGIVDVAATAVHYGVACISLSILPSVAANALGFLTAVPVSYAGYDRWSFRRVGRGSTTARFQRFLVTATGGLALSQAVLLLAETFAQLPPTLSIFAAVLVGPAATFLGAKLWVFV